ncbi:MAG: C-GCAxxG-C-C family protein [Tannerellaceae bacterium]|nr:C-GCAxxG-C-C family protein [Tannerellaceae bacterium]
MSINTDFVIEDRVQLALNYFLEGYNCAQSVFMAYADLVGLDKETASCLSVSLGGGMGRLREVCGTVSAMFMLNGFKYPVYHVSSQEERTVNYANVQRLATAFKELNGTIICRELLSSLGTLDTHPVPSLRTSEYYKKRPCCRFVADAAYLIGQTFKES